MVNRLEPINLTSFVGGLNLRRSQFQLADDESPDLLNVDIDPRGGFFTRRGWQRWSKGEIVDLLAETWEPCNTFVINHGDGSQVVYVVNHGKIYYAEEDAVFHRLGTLVGSALTHGADFNAWGSDTYIALGMDQVPVRVSRLFAITPLAPTWSEVDAPVSNCMPQCGLIETHAGYLFCARTQEAGVQHYNRVRWSHPLKPDSWRELDYIDIEAGGGRITGLLSYSDHLLIFKTNSMWALYGYNQDSWQLVQVSQSIGLPGPVAKTRSEKVVYFFSSSDRNGMYGYNGGQPLYLSEGLRPAFEEIFNYESVFVSWAGRRLWVSVPWRKGEGSTTKLETVFVYDPDISDIGAWTMYRSDFGTPGPVLDGSDVNSRFPLAALWSTTSSMMVTLDAIDEGYDILDEFYKVGATTATTITDLATGAGDTIAITTSTAQGRPFDAYYRTRWLHGGWPDRKKSWRRPTFVCRHAPQDTDLLVEIFRDYNESDVARTRTLHLRSLGAHYWTEGGFDDTVGNGFDWAVDGDDNPRGADWGTPREGATLQRSGSMGLARAVQMRVRLAPSTPKRRWGVNAIVAKIVMRRFR